MTFDASEESPLHWSLCAEDSACLRLLLGTKADVELRGGLGLTALNTAANDGIGMPFVDILLQFGANIESKDIYGQRPLHRATIRNHGPMSAVLLKKGADINATTSAGTTALHLALTSNTNEVLRTLLDNANLDYNVKDVYWGTLLHYAAYYADIETLDILKSKRLEELDIADKNGLEDGYTAMQYASWRKDFNEKWSKALKQPRDDDPVRWYVALQELLDSITTAINLSAGRFPNEGGVTERHMFAESSDEEDCEENGNPELWQDALEEPREII
ncbi:hypothetical protein OEA41_001460 [Lepraria neglecta]|uniref:Ankyrin n=1 Tax=Lepraria neglecta TaxID=209136 RepID=A0AAD9Z9T1_9LECA|nr:hypothetical protein OEA41_001460 [Lepraria neglecta]